MWQTVSKMASSDLCLLEFKHWMWEPFSHLFRAELCDSEYSGSDVWFPRLGSKRHYGFSPISFSGEAAIVLWKQSGSFCGETQWHKTDNQHNLPAMRASRLVTGSSRFIRPREDSSPSCNLQRLLFPETPNPELLTATFQLLLHRNWDG